jgi:hypothetical protein
LRDELGREIFLQVELCPDRVDGAGVRATKVEQHLRGIGGATLDKNARWGARPDFPDDVWPWSGRDKFAGVVHCSNQVTATKESFLPATYANAAAIRTNNPDHCSIVKAPNVWPRKRQ